MCVSNTSWLCTDVHACSQSDIHVLLHLSTKLTSRQSAKKKDLNFVPYTLLWNSQLDRFISLPSFTLDRPSSPLLPDLGGPSVGKCLGCGNILTAELAAGVTAALQDSWKHVWNVLPLSGLLKIKSGLKRQNCNIRLTYWCFWCFLHSSHSVKLECWGGLKEYSPLSFRDRDLCPFSAISNTWVWL